MTESTKVSDAEKRPTIEPIVYDLPTTTETASKKVDDLVQERKEDFRKRAERFGGNADRIATDVDVIGARRAGIRNGFITGFDTTSTEELERRAARAKRFNSENNVVSTPSSSEKKPEIMDPALIRIDPLERRRDPSSGELLKENVIHIFGVDDMSTKDVLGHFHAYGPSWCEWLNDSSCNVAFEDEHTMMRALLGMAEKAKEAGVEKIAGDAPVDKMDDSEGAGQTRSAEENNKVEKTLIWKTALPYKKDGKIMPLWIRQATFGDKRPEAPNPESKWSRNVQGQKRRQHSEMKGRKRRGSEDKRDRERKGNGMGEDDGNRRKSRQGVGLGVNTRMDKQAAISKARWKKVTKMDLDKALSS